METLITFIPILLSVALVTIGERRTMGSMQRRIGPNIVGYYGLFQAFADAFKLLLKEYVSPTQANVILFFMGPIITLIFSLLAYAIIPYGPGIAISDFNLGVLYILAVSSLSTYGILLAGWSANSKYAFLGSLRSTAQLISYELILSSALLIVIFLTGSLNITVIIESQRAIWFVIPLLPLFVIFLIGSIAETNRSPFDLAEAESELVSGFMTEHSAVIFVFFFLAEYASIVFISLLISIVFLGGYLFNFMYLLYIIKCLHYIPICIDYIISYNKFEYYIDFDHYVYLNYKYYGYYDFHYTPNDSISHGIILGLKTCIIAFIFIWTRASLPRIRFDQLMSYCWTILLPLVIAFIILVPCILYSFGIIPSNIFLF
uniref:NADH-ubiquinone oxidoreductase chain 1 n=1 Tax=Coccocarpia palmicola TaxID=301477 RepID=A0A1V0FWC3_9LECA|nr:NADH dehydrogenase subunit 1 [Coccocarpia palmicola]ARB49952.1 NADH dehydrogenase subunit 1 [Coccocarpia palmicola]